MSSLIRAVIRKEVARLFSKYGRIMLCFFALRKRLLFIFFGRKTLWKFSRPASRKFWYVNSTQRQKKCRQMPECWNKQKTWKSLGFLPSICQQRRTLFQWMANGYFRCNIPKHVIEWRSITKQLRYRLILVHECHCSRACSTFGIYCQQIAKKEKKIAHILQKSEQLFDFGFLPILVAFLGVEEVAWDDIPDIRTPARIDICKLILVNN